MINPIEKADSWNDQKARLKQKLGILTGNEFMHEEGNQDIMPQTLPIIPGMTKEELAILIKNL